MKTKRVVVVGAGLGGLSAAAYLSRNGFEVDVFDRNSYPGGYACSFVREGFEFEASLHELSGIGPEGDRGGCYRVLEGCDVARRVELIPIPDFYTSVFPEFTVTVPYGWEAAQEAYTEQFPEEREGIANTLEFMRNMYEELNALTSAESIVDFLTFPVKGSHVIRSTGLTTQQYLDREMKDPRLKALFTDIWGYYGLPPSRLSFQLFAMANASYINHGPYHVKGTSQALSNAFVEVIEENGGRVHLSNGVTAITTSNGRVTGVETAKGDLVRADYVVSNANPIHAVYDLIGADNVPASYLKALAAEHIAISTFNVYMGLDCPGEEVGMSNHEIFYNATYDHDIHYDAMYQLNTPPYWAITNYNASDPEFSPPGTCVLVITSLFDYSPWMRVPPERYAEEKRALAAGLIDSADRFVAPGLKDHLKVVEVSTPLTNMRYSGNPGGSILGFDYSVTGSSMFRLPNKGPLEGLYFANAWVRLGGGFETCITSGFLAYHELKKDADGARGLKKYLPTFA